MNTISIVTKTGAELTPLHYRGLIDRCKFHQLPEVGRIGLELCRVQDECVEQDIKPWEAFLAKFYITLVEDYALSRNPNARIRGLQELFPEILGVDRVYFSIEEHRHPFMEIYRRGTRITLWLPPSHLYHATGFGWIDRLRKDVMDSNPHHLTGVGRTEYLSSSSILESLRSTRDISIDGRTDRRALCIIDPEPGWLYSQTEEAT